MRLENFELLSEIELQSDGVIWDLHNVSKFDGLELVPAENLAVMRWSMPSAPKHRRGVVNDFSGVMLHFKNLKSLSIGSRDAEMPLTEDTCVSQFFKVDATSEVANPFFRTRRDWKPEDSFRLLFEFQSRRVIEIESEMVELIPLS